MDEIDGLNGRILFASGDAVTSKQHNVNVRRIMQLSNLRL